MGDGGHAFHVPLDCRAAKLRGGELSGERGFAAGLMRERRLQCLRSQRHSG